MSEMATRRRAPTKSLWDRITLWSGEREVRAVGPERVDEVALPGTDRAVQIRRPYPAEPDPEDYPPHWCEIWPAGVVLAGVIAREPWRLRGQRVLEVGPGAGVTAVAAAQAGADLVLIDYAAASLALTARNVREQTGVEPRTVLINWREPSAKFLELVGDGFAVVLGADMLYEMKDARPLARFLERVVAVDGEVWITHPGRDAAERLVEILRGRGWQGPSEECATPIPDPQDNSWDIMQLHRLRRPA
jgi:predicted nicotinamide N-methyase